MILEGHGASYTRNHLANFAGMDRKSGPVKTGPTRVVDRPTPVCGLLKLTWVYYIQGGTSMSFFEPYTQPSLGYYAS